MPTEPQEPADEATLLSQMNAEALRRTRRYWTWIALVPAPALVAALWALIFLLPAYGDAEAESIIALLLSGAWIIYCTVRIALTWHTASVEMKWLRGFWLALLLAVLNTALFFGLLLASCAVTSSVIP